MTENNNSDIVLTLVARGHRAHVMWADTHNKAFYIPPTSQATTGEPREPVVDPNNPSRELTPSSEDPCSAKPSEPKLQITFSHMPKNPDLGYVLGSDRESCDILLGTLDDCIGHLMFAITFNEDNEVVMKSSSINETVVAYRKQTANRKNFTWIFSVGEQISVHAAERIMFTLEVPNHQTDKAAYEANCSNFMKMVNSSSRTINLLNHQNRPDTEPMSGEGAPPATAEPPFYLRSTKLGSGGFGVVHKARSMPDGEIVALKRFKSKNAWTLETSVLRKLFKTPHDNIVKIINFGLGDAPYLAMGLAPGGNLEEQHKSKPFNSHETGLILRQMLDALVYLHVDFGITHRDIKPANILCDSRAHFRLADFGLAKEGDHFMTFNGTESYMAPEMFEKKPYTARVDLWGLGMVIAWISTGNRPPGFKGNEGPRWCAAVVACFEKYEKRFQAIGTSDPKQIGINILVGQSMLRMKPEDRDSASGCLQKGHILWKMLDRESEDANRSPIRASSSPSTLRANNATGASNELTEKTRAIEGNKALGEEESAAREANGPSEDDESSGGNVSEAETEILEGRTLTSEEWQSLERQFPFNAGNGGENQSTVRGPQHFVYPPSFDPFGNVEEDQSQSESGVSSMDGDGGTVAE